MIKVTTKQSAKDFIESLKEIFGEKIIPEWRIDSEGDFEPTFTDKGWMRAKAEGENVVKFCYIQRKDRDVTNYSYSTMHCSLAEILLRFLDYEIESLSISPMFTEDDFYKGKDEDEEKVG